MTALDLFLRLTAAGCQLSRMEDRLRVHDPQRILTDALRQHIRRHKQELLALLASSVPTHATAGELSPQQEHVSPAPPPYLGSPVGAPFRPGQQVWLYRWDDQTPRFNVPVTIVQLRTLPTGEQDIGWCN